MDVEEKPLVVQLNWNKDDREGRFVLKNENDAAPPKVGPPPSSWQAAAPQDVAIRSVPRRPACYPVTLHSNGH